jgi:hypothetical protein
LEEVFNGLAAKGDVRSPAERRYDLAEALRWAMSRALAMAGNVILAIDDLQRVDGSSRCAFADALGEPPAGRGLLVIGAHTPGLDAGWGAHHAARVIGGLPPPIVTRLLQSARPSERMMAVSEAGVRGIPPLYVDQVLRFAAEGGSDPPPRLADLISQRMATQEPSARRVMQALGILGDLIEPSAIAELLALPGSVDDPLSSLVAAGLVEKHEGTVSLSHPLIREIVLGAIPAEVRRDLARALRRLERRTRLAHHRAVAERLADLRREPLPPPGSAHPAQGRALRMVEGLARGDLSLLVSAAGFRVALA